ncbi:tetratricopeptide repeat protein [Trinickia terrae]|uniref:Tetratricopeptide repeat protein n=1 Tax=Trinickia terrae TaxID=2571161 RepID=A0A4U1I3N2_9BURK|nr:tetratricopeptide repeat protein [Trinickia terrae]TKC87815.1 tetratricopeptide repeat protein [Trinickia terrae]
MTRDPQHARGVPQAAEPLDALWRALDAAPQDAALHRSLADALRSQGDELGALAHSIAAQTLEARAAGSPDVSAGDLCMVATGYFMKGDTEAAVRWYRLVLAIDPNVAVAYQNLAAIHADEGRFAEAEACRAKAYAIQRVFVERAGDPVRDVLILCTGQGAGNVPFDALLPSAACGRIKYAIDYARDEEDAQLPPYDLVFNAIGDPDVAAPLMARLERFAARCERALLNPPAAIARTFRDRLPGLLRDLDGVAAAACVRAEAAPASRDALLQWLAAAGIVLPVLARPTATHGGEGLARCDSLDALQAKLKTLDGTHYMTAFVDTHSADGYYRKYRMIFVDREPYPYHLAISPHWMVHYFSAEMEQHAWKLDEERRFLEDPRAALGDRAMAAIAAIARRLDLDYGGIDFTVLPDGRVFVFEANATMLAHYERSDGVLAHKNKHVQRIVDAFGQLQALRASVRGAE